MNWRSLVLAGAAVSLAIVHGCGGNEPGPIAVSGKAKSTMPPIVHEPCGEKGAGAINHDSDGDTKPEVISVMKDGRVACIATYAGRTTAEVASGAPRRVDMYEYFDANGKPRRREFAYGERGLINAIEVYEGGVLRRREYDLVGTKRIDTIDYFDGAGPDPKTGKHRPSKRERDTNNDGQIDQWWTFGINQVTIEMDQDADGKTEREATMVMSDSGQVLSVGGVAVVDPNAPKPTPATSDAGARTAPAGDAANVDLTSVTASDAGSRADAPASTKDGGA